MLNLETILQGGDLRSIGQSNKIVSFIEDQKGFDALFQLLLHSDRKIVMRAADAIEKISVAKPGYLEPHKKAIFDLSEKAINKELKWHLALILSRLSLTKKERDRAWQLLAKWSGNQEESRIVRVNSLQALFTLSQQDEELRKQFLQIITEIEKENVPSLNARIRKLKLSD